MAGTTRDPTIVDVTVGERLRKRREALEISQDELAQGLGITYQQLQKYERGDNRISAGRLYDAAKNVTLTGHYFWPGVIMLSQTAWNKLSDEQKKALVEAGRETTKESYVLAASQEADTIAFLKEKGVTIDKIADLDKMRELTAPVVEKWKAQDPLIAKIADRFAAGN